MKPTTEQVRDWAIRCGDDWESTLPDDKRLIQDVAALAYAAGVAAMQERCLGVCEGEVAFNTAHPPINASVAAYRCVKAIRALGDDE